VLPSLLSRAAWTIVVRRLSHCAPSFDQRQYTDHWHDILVGSIVGLVFAYFSYRQYYPPLSSELAHRPYSPRIKRDEDGDDTQPYLPTHHDTYSDRASPVPGPASSQPAKYGGESRRRESPDRGDAESITVPGTVHRNNLGHLSDTWREGDRGEQRERELEMRGPTEQV
jgi:diacylglycerol diphosphate phosphatase / phosphatidate phosphatase